MDIEGRCYIQIGGRLTVWTPARIFSTGGGDADVEETAFCRAALPGALRRVGVDFDHRSLLAARLVPEAANDS